MLVKFEQNRRPMVQTTQNFEHFDKNKVFLKLFLTKRWRHFVRLSELFNVKRSIYTIFQYSKIMAVRHV